MQTVNFQAPTDYSAEQEKIARSRKYAELMQQQSMQPLESQTAGGWVVPTSPLQGMAKLLQAYGGRKGQENADEKQKALAEALKTERARTNLEAETALKGTPALPANEMDFNGTQAQAPSLERALSAYMNSNDPAMQQMGQSLKFQQLAAALKPTEGAFSKVNPHEYTPESLKLFMASGGKDFSVLKPREKIVADNLGGRLSYRGEYSTAPVASADKGMTPDAAATLAQRQYEWNNLSPKQKADLQNDAARIGISAQELFFNTGLSGGGAARIPQGTVGQMPMVPQGAQMPPQAPQMAPQPVPQAQGAPMPARVAQAPQQAPMAPQAPVNPALAALTPKARAEIAKEQAQQAIGGTKDANSVLNLMDGVEKLIDKAHGSGVGNMVGGVQNFLGISSDKNNADAQLKALEGALVSKMPKMSGPQSDKDVLLYRQMAGELGNPSLPADVRKAAAETVRGIQRTYLNGFSATGYQPDNSGYNGPDRRSTSGKIKRYNPATGMIE